MRGIVIFLLLCCMCIDSVAEEAAIGNRLTGHVTDAVDGEPLIGVTVSIVELSRTTVTDINGHYEFLQLPERTLTLQVSYVGHQTIIEKVSLKGDITHDFVMCESNAMLNEVVVNSYAGSGLIKDTPTPVSVVTFRELAITSSTNIIDAIARQPGVAQVTTGNGISKPVIRGLGYNRIVTVNDGIRQEGQQWGDEHGIEVDAQSVSRIDILKGPASLMYGSDAMAGIVVFHGDPLPPQGKVRGTVSTEYQSNSGMMGYSLHAAGNHQDLVWSARYSGKMAHAYKNPADGYVLGSQYREQALRGMAGINRLWGFSHLTLSYYHFTPGMIEGERDDETGEFLQAVALNGEEGSRRATHHDLTTYGHGFPYQQIHHYKAVADNMVNIGEGSLKMLLGYQHNRRQEFEEVLTPHDCGLDLMLHTLNYDIHYIWQNHQDWKWNVGAGGMYQQSLNKGEECLIPDYVLMDIGAFGITTYAIGGWKLSGGLRFDNRHLHSFGKVDLFEPITRSFNALTGSMGAVRELSERATLRFNLARGFRAPNISELGSNGEHEGTFRYEQGNAELKPEYSWQADAGWDYTSPVVSVQAAIFANLIDNYIFAHRLAGVETDGLPTYAFTQGDARLWGAEIMVDVHPIERLHIENSFSYVNAVQLHQPESSKYLPFTPAPRIESEISYDLIRDGKVLNNTFIHFGLECCLKQDHFHAADDTETGTPSYTLFRMSAGTDIRSHGRTLCTLCLNAENLANRSYQNHLSRLKYCGINPRTGRQGIFNMGRNITLKASVYF